MVHRRIYIKDWKCDYWFLEEKDTQIWYILSQLRDMGADDEILDNVVELLENRNTGFIFTNPEYQRSLVIVGKTTSGEEFLNTFIHETIHLTGIISSMYEADMKGEKIAYMIGDACQLLADIICKFSCNHCRDSA